MLEGLTITIWQDKKIKAIKIGTEKIKLVLFADGIIAYEDNYKEFIKQPSRIHKWVHQGHRIQDTVTKINCISI